MNNFVNYSIQTICMQFVFLIVYQLLFAKETFFNWNRIYLIGSMLVSLILPKLEFSFSQMNTETIQLNEIILKANFNNNVSSFSENQFFKNDFINTVYVIGSFVFLVLFSIKLVKLFKLKKTSKKLVYEGFEINIVENSNEAFSFLNLIFIGENNLDFKTILNHELIHKSKKHSLDLIFIEIAKIVFWFNPLLYVYQNKLAEVHEFEADASSVSLDKKKYYETIINQVFQVENITFTNNFFNQSLLKKRIVMLQRSKSKRSSLIKYFLIVPMLFVCILFFSNCVDKEEETIVYRTNATAEDKVIEENKSEELTYEYFENVDEVPRFSACGEVPNEEVLDCFNEQMNLHIKKNFSYPEAAVEQNIQGKVAIQFTIDKEGNVKDIVAKGFENGTLLELEAIRIIKALPKFIPAKKDGKAVNVKYGLPITFKLM